MLVRPIVIALVALAFANATAARADDRLLSDDSFAVRSTGTLRVDGALLVAMPSALPSGMAYGLSAGITRECGCHLAYGARASWVYVSESSTFWNVMQQDLRLRATGSVRHVFGRGSLALQLGLGTNIVYEDRTRAQGMAAMLSGSALETRALAALPAADLEAVVALHVAGPWLMIVSGGPTVDVLSGNLRGGWTAELGVGWQP
jgi:hypothetical protein